MKILFVGDIVGKPGRKALRDLLPGLVDRHRVDLVIGNVENVANGMGVSKDALQEVKKAGIQIMTSGNHVWKRSGIEQVLEEERSLLRPANYADGVPGRGFMVWESNLGTKVGVINLLGRVFLEAVDCPFRVGARIAEKLRQEGARICIVDFHAEATSEKAALGWFLDGKVSGVLGTHTHVQTSDERVLPRGTGFITDVGMTGGRDSVIGVKIEASLKRFLTGVPQPFEPSARNLVLEGALLEVCEETGRCLEIRRVRKCLDTSSVREDNTNCQGNRGGQKET